MKRFNIIITLSATLGLFSCELDSIRGRWIPRLFLYGVTTMTRS